MNMLSEGGNVFKDADGVPVTQRIRREDVKPTLAWLERLLPGLDIQNNTLGSTGIKDTSGDLDIAVDANQVTKAQLEAQLARWAMAQGQDPKDWVRKSGTAVHFKTPIGGNADNGFVQTDFMLLNNVPWSKFVLGAMPPDSQYKGRERNVMMNSIAKSLGYKLNQVAGIADRATNQIISADPDQVAKILLNPRATSKDLASVESIAQALATDPKRDAKLADFREHMARENLPFKESVDLYRPVDDVGFLARLRDRIVNQGMQPLIENRDERVQHLREAKNPRIPYVEDLVFQAGLRGARQAVDIIRQAAANAQEYVTIKWDGSPAVIFGRNEQGEFVLTDKAGATAVAIRAWPPALNKSHRSWHSVIKLLLLKANELTVCRPCCPCIKNFGPCCRQLPRENFKDTSRATCCIRRRIPMCVMQATWFSTPTSMMASPTEFPKAVNWDKKLLPVAWAWPYTHAWMILAAPSSPKLILKVC